MVKYIRESLLKTPGKPNPPTYGVLQEDGLAEVVRPMGLNESLFEPSPRVLEAIVDNLDKIGRYPDAQPPRLSKKISNMFEIEEDLIVWGNGSEERDLLYIDDLTQFVNMVITKQDQNFS